MNLQQRSFEVFRGIRALRVARVMGEVNARDNRAEAFVLSN